MVVIINKLAKRDYQVADTMVAGVVLTGAEVKTIREGRGSLRDAYAKFISGELFLVGADIPQYKNFAGRDYDAKRSRKLLAKSSELLKLQKKIEGKPLTLVPLRLFFKNRWVKCEIGIGKGKKELEKREDIKKRDIDREIAKTIKSR